MHRTSVLALSLAFTIIIAANGRGQGTRPAKNLLANPSFELGQDLWRSDVAGKTVARFAVDRQEAVEGNYSALLTVEAVEEWGLQFGQSVDAGEAGKTYTFAVFARSVKGTADVDLEIERRAKPYDRAAALGKTTLPEGRWTELHVTFQVRKAFPEGWFAYLSCRQANCQVRVDMFRLYEGEYVAFKDVPREPRRSAVRLFETGAPSAAPLTAEALAKRDRWTEVAEGDAQHKFAGDVVVLNNALAVVTRWHGAGIEVYSVGPAGATLRAVLRPLTTCPVSALTTLAVASQTRQGVALDATFDAGEGHPATLRLELKVGEPFLRTEARKGITALRIEAPCRFGVLPDFFADDLVADATALPADQAELPAENFFLHLVGDGQAIVTAVWTTSDEDLRVFLSGVGAKRTIDASEIRYVKDGSIWVAVTEAPGLWHVRDVPKAEAGKVIQLDWRAAFPAQWRVDWRRADGLVDSWEMLAQQKDGTFLKYGWFGSPGTLPADRKRWTTVLGNFLYPCWTDTSGQGFVQPLKSPKLVFDGPAVIYPINRAPGTPLDIYTVVDVVRGTLGVGPCEYILDVEGQKSAYRGRATCSTRDILNPIYEKRQQKQKEALVQKTLDEVTLFLKHIRGRIDDYATFGHDLLAYLDTEKKAHPELDKPLDELAALTKNIDARVAGRQDHIKTPADHAAMVQDFRTNLVGYEGPDAYTKCQAWTRAIVDIGGNQDELAGECRWAVKVVRQRAGLLAAADPRLAPVAREIRRRTQIALRNPAGHEAARH